MVVAGFLIRLERADYPVAVEQMMIDVELSDYGQKPAGGLHTHTQ